MNARLRLPLLLVVTALVALGCSTQEAAKPAFTGDIAKGNPVPAETPLSSASGDAPEPIGLDPVGDAELQASLEETPPGCEVLTTRSCLLPFPSDAYTVADITTGTDP